MANRFHSLNGLIERRAGHGSYLASVGVTPFLSRLVVIVERFPLLECVNSSRSEWDEMIDMPKIGDPGCASRLSDGQNDLARDLPLGQRLQRDRHLIDGKRAADMRLQAAISVPP